MKFSQYLTRGTYIRTLHTDHQRGSLMQDSIVTTQSFNRDAYLRFLNLGPDATWCAIAAAQTELYRQRLAKSFNLPDNATFREILSAQERAPPRNCGPVGKQ